jgi:1-deoxy-D-xylulose-5-phosphate synthase
MNAPRAPDYTPHDGSVYINTPSRWTQTVFPGMHAGMRPLIWPGYPMVWYTRVEFFPNHNSECSRVLTTSPENHKDESTPLLDGVNNGADLKSLSLKELRELAEEMRKVIIGTASRNGGHLAPHLGVVDLAIALHYVFDFPNDKLIWDVGHQCYPHKLLTGRRGQIHSIRRRGGLSGYPKMSESEYDAFGTGHSSTSISAALGIRAASDALGHDRHAIAVIGDGAMTGGMAFEALAHAGHLGKNVLIILNDNRMSISPNKGALSSYFSRLITGGLYTKAAEDFHGWMQTILGDRVTQRAKGIESSFKGMITGNTLFEQLGSRYVGPIDGHDLDTLIACLENLKNLKGPVFFHCVTKKGKGYSYAEDDPLTYHGVKSFNIQTGKFDSSVKPDQHPPKKVPTFTDVFADALIEAANEDARVCAITAAMPTGTGLSTFEKHFPERTFDVGICEQHAVTFAGGLASQGMRPVAAIYSTFLQRGYDQYIHDICIQNLPVVFAIDRAGAVGEDSPTQQGAFDLSFLRVIPNVKLMAPRDDLDMRSMLHWSLTQNGPVGVRYARGAAPTIGEAEGRDITRGEILREGADGYFLAIGPVISNCLAAAEALSRDYSLSIGVADARWIKPLDAELLDRIKHLPIVTVEENTVLGGFGSAVLEHFQREGCLHEIRMTMAGFPDAFIEHGTRDEQLRDIKLDPISLAETARSLVQPQPAAQAVLRHGT